MSGKFEHFGRALDRCESFIERKFLHELVWSDRYSFNPAHEGHCIGRDDQGIELHQQVTETGCRIDFALIAGKTRIAIELDGHEFHHATKEQVERDNRRTTDLTAWGWTVIRFSGREVNADVRDCVQRAYHVARTRFDGQARRAPPAPEEAVESGPPLTAEELHKCAEDLLRQLDALDEAKPV